MTIYLGDNGRAFCGQSRCAGATVTETGRDLRGDGVTPYRAAYWQSDDGQGEVVLTLPEHSHLSDDALIAEAEREAGKPGVGLDLSGGRIIVGDWREGA